MRPYFWLRSLVTSCLGGVIIAVDRLLFTNADEQSAMVERVERPRQSWQDSQIPTPRLSQRNE
jgi:hypothetical protein